MAVYENGVCKDNQIDDGDPELMESARYVQVVKIARAAGSFVGRVTQAPGKIAKKTSGIIDQLNHATGRM